MQWHRGKIDQTRKLFFVFFKQLLCQYSLSLKAVLGFSRQSWAPRAQQLLRCSSSSPVPLKPSGDSTTRSPWVCSPSTQLVSEPAVGGSPTGSFNLPCAPTLSLPAFPCSRGDAGRALSPEQRLLTSAAAYCIRAYVAYLYVGKINL